MLFNQITDKNCTKSTGKWLSRTFFNDGSGALFVFPDARLGARVTRRPDMCPASVSYRHSTVTDLPSPAFRDDLGALSWDRQTFALNHKRILLITDAFWSRLLFVSDFNVRSLPSLSFVKWHRVETYR